jgi:hypothetical protein
MSEKTPLRTYKEFDIYVNQSGTFRADGIDTEFKTLDELIEEIEKESKIKYNPVDGFIVGNSQVIDVLITRPHKPSYSTRYQSFWVSHKNIKKRETGYPVIDNENNRKLVQKYIDNSEMMKQLMRENNELEKLMHAEPIVLEKVVVKK